MKFTKRAMVHSKERRESQKEFWDEHHASVEHGEKTSFDTPFLPEHPLGRYEFQGCALPELPGVTPGVLTGTVAIP